MGVLLAGLLSVPSTVLELTTTLVTCVKQATAAERPAAVPTITNFGVSHINGASPLYRVSAPASDFPILNTF